VIAIPAQLRYFLYTSIRLSPIDSFISISMVSKRSNLLSTESNLFNSCRYLCSHSCTCKAKLSDSASTVSIMVLSVTVSSSIAMSAFYFQCCFYLPTKYGYVLYVVCGHITHIWIVSFFTSFIHFVIHFDQRIQII